MACADFVLEKLIVVVVVAVAVAVAAVVVASNPIELRWP